MKNVKGKGRIAINVKADQKRFMLLVDAYKEMETPYLSRYRHWETGFQTTSILPDQKKLEESDKPAS